MPRYLIEEPTPFEPKSVWEEFLAAMKRLDQTDPDVIDAIARAEAHLATQFPEETADPAVATIIDLLLAEEAQRLAKVPCLNADATRAAGLDPGAVYKEIMADPSRMAAHAAVIVERYAAEDIGAEELIQRIFDVVQALDGDGSAIVALKPEVAERHAVRFPGLVGRRFVLFNDTDDQPPFSDSPDETGSPCYASPRLWTLTADGSAVERQDAADVRLHPEHGLEVHQHLEGGPLPARILDAVWLGAFGGKRASRLTLDPPALKVQASDAFRCRFREQRGPEAVAMSIQDGSPYVTFAMRRKPVGHNGSTP